MEHTASIIVRGRTVEIQLDGRPEPIRLALAKHHARLIAYALEVGAGHKAKDAEPALAQFLGERLYVAEVREDPPPKADRPVVRLSRPVKLGRG